jgi:SAM-dependent methyltransferase
MTPEAYLDLARAEEQHWWYVSRRHIIRDTLSRMKLPAGARILEVGSGTGGNLEMLAEFGQVSAVEMDAGARELARRKTSGKFEILEGVCPKDMPYSGETFDLICMFDVLEHIPESTESLRRLNAMLAPGGRIIISVPAYQWLWSPHDRFLHHKRRYTTRQVYAEAHAAGLVVDRATYMNMMLFPLAVIARLRDRLMRSETSTGMATPAPLMNRFFRSVFCSETRLLHRVNLPFGVSIMAILSAAS